MKDYKIVYNFFFEFSFIKMKIIYIILNFEFIYLTYGFLASFNIIDKITKDQKNFILL